MIRVSEIEDVLNNLENVEIAEEMEPLMNNTKDDCVRFKCKVGSMGKKGKIIWIPTKHHETFEEFPFVEVIIRQMK